MIAPDSARSVKSPCAEVSVEAIFVAASPPPAPALTSAPAIGPSRPTTRPSTSTPGCIAIRISGVSRPLRIAKPSLVPGARAAENATAT